MLKLLSFFVIFCLYKNILVLSIADTESVEKVFYNLDEVDKLFKDFIAKYNKKYDDEEYKKRQKIFEDNLIKINKWNHEQPDTVFGIGPLADMSYEEFLRSYTGVFRNETNENVVQYKPNGMAPESLDWRNHNYVTRVKNQQQCGSCYVFSAIGNIEGQHAKKHGQLISLSEQQGLDCNPHGCEGGWPHDVMEALAKEGGSMKEEVYPYVQQKQQCRTDRNGIVVRVTGGSQIRVNNEEELKDALAQYGPLAVAMYTSQEMMHLARSSNVFIPTKCDSGLHAVVLVGYDNDGGVPYWIIKNSWGENWNGNGYLLLVRGRQACSIGLYVATATVD